jgi:hypothetical protein
MGGTTVIGVGKVVVDEISRADALAERDRDRPRNGTRWLAPVEHKSLDALAALIIPSDGAGPGAHETGIVDTIDRLLANTPNLRTLYASGLLAFDELALHEYGRTFTDLKNQDQTHLLKLVDEIYEGTKSGGPSITKKLGRKARELYHRWPAPGAWGGLGAALQLFPQLMKDVKEGFYTSAAAWDWLGYDGPPFPAGYFGRPGKCSSKEVPGRV